MGQPVVAVAAAVGLIALMPAVWAVAGPSSGAAAPQVHTTAPMQSDERSRRYAVSDSYSLRCYRVTASQRTLRVRQYSRLSGSDRWQEYETLAQRTRGRWYSADGIEYYRATGSALLSGTADSIDRIPRVRRAQWDRWGCPR